MKINAYFFESGKAQYSMILSKRLSSFVTPQYNIGCKVILIYNPLDLTNEYTVRQLFKEILKEFISDYNPEPIILTSTLYNFTNDLISPNGTQSTIEQLVCQHRFLSPLYNSSVWIRFIEWGELEKELEKTIREFEIFRDFYSINTAKESFEYFIRKQSENYLNKIFSGHANSITPKLYPNELAFADQILSINTTSITHDEIEVFHEATFRILLIDDKDRINVTNEKNEQKENKQKETSKAKIVAELLSAKPLESFVNKENKKSHINQRLVWDTEKIEHYYFPTDKEKMKNAKEEKKNVFDIDLHASSSHTQIVQITNLTDAIVLLADHRIRFDLIMLDYLLDKKDENDNDRELATNFFLWFQDKHCENGEVEYLREKLMKLKVMGCEAIKDIICSQELNRLEKDYIKAENAEIQEKVLAKIKNVSMSEKQSFNRALRELVKGNRGPLKKFWFFPITAFNSTFIDDLVHNHVRLIDYYWHISKGADPITTPYTFLSLLNKFFYLQLENSVFLQSEIIRFLRSTITRLQEVNNYNDFVAVMGNDYASFVVKFVSRPNFCRDRATSLFSDYVWNEFYKKGEYETLHILVNYAHKFYHRCAFGTKDDYTKIVIFLRDMKMYIDEYFPDWNRRGDHYVDMARLSDIVDKCFGKQ